MALSFPASSSRVRAPRRWSSQLGAFPPMRMPRDTGGYLLTQVDVDPAGGCAGFTAVWHEFLDPTDTGDGDLVLQLHTPDSKDPDEPLAEQRVAVSLWLARDDAWQRVRFWPQTGPGWPHQVAPWIHAGLAHAPTPTTGSTTRATRDGASATGQ